MLGHGGSKMSDITYKNKINRIRTFALSLIFIGFGIMYIGLLVKKSRMAYAYFYYSWYDCNRI